jgi:glutaredoxin
MLFKVYGKPNCGYCKKAVKLLAENNIPYQYYTVGKSSDEDAHITKEELEDMIGMSVTTVPQIVLGNHKYIGGYEQLCDYLIEEDLV